MEGLRAYSDDKGELRYKVEPGVFRALCDAARFGSTGSDTSSGDATAVFRVDERFGGGYMVRRASGDVLELEKPNGRSLPIGMSLIEGLAGHVRAGRLTIEDIEKKQVFEKIPEIKLEPYLVNGYSNILPALVKRVCDRVPTSDEQGSAPPGPRVLIIDEINRGNISRVLGELITLIEPSKREGGVDALTVTLPYSKDLFSVPNNVYLIGTMNTVDRSLSSLDMALRRRFVFREMPPRAAHLDGVLVEGLDVGALLRVMNQRIEVLLDRDHCLGHAYFWPLKREPSLTRLAEIFRWQLIPLLQEYFFEDWERIAWVLNDHRKPPGRQFLTRSPLDAEALFGDNMNGRIRVNGWRLEEDAFDHLDSYLGVIGPVRNSVATQALPPTPTAEGEVELEARMNGYLLKRYKSQTIEILRNAEVQSNTMAVLRTLATELGVSQTNGSDNPFNTRQLGLEVMRKIKGLG